MILRSAQTALAAFVVAVAVSLDVSGQEVAFTFFLAVGGTMGMLWRLIRIRSTAAIFPFAAPHLLISGWPICLLVACACNATAMSKAEDLRKALLSKPQEVSLGRAYGLFCRAQPKHYCGFYSYRIDLDDRGSLEASRLIVRLFGERRVALSLLTGQLSPPEA